MDRTTSAPRSTTSDNVDYKDEIPLNFMDVNYNFAVIIMVALGMAAVIGTFGNLLILVAVATHRYLRSVESVFIINLACCDLCVTMIAEPLSIVAKTVGWRSFEGVPGACRAIGYLCTLSCISSLMSLSIMSLNRYVLICHHTLYGKIFTSKKCLLYCFLMYLFGLFLISFNWYGIGDHSFDYKSYECVWDRMASHDYTIVFSILLVWVPIFVTGVAYGRIYWYVNKVRTTVNKHRAVRTETSNMEDLNATPSTSMAENGKNSRDKDGDVHNTKAWEDEDKNNGEMNGHKHGEASTAGNPLDQETSQDTTKADRNTDSVPSKINQSQESKENNGNNGSFLQIPQRTRRSVTASVRFSSTSDSHDSPAQRPVTPKTLSELPKEPAKTTSTHPGLSLARPLFIIYVVFSTCWIPYSLVIIFDSRDTFPHELHAFITAFAHLNSSINWLVYYHTHSKMRQAFRRLLRLGGPKPSSVQPLTTVISLKSVGPSKK